jgi:hypothetical protein
VATGAANVADANRRLAEEQAAAAGTTLSAAESGDVWRDSMIQQAAAAQGPLRQAILDYIASVEGVPPEKLTAIQAAVEAGDLEEAQRLLDEASATRAAELRAEAQTDLAAADLDAAAAAARVAVIVADAEKQAAEEDLTGLAAQERTAEIVAEALTSDANADLELSAEDREAIVTAIARTGTAESVLANLARPRETTLRVKVQQTVTKLFGWGVDNAEGGIYRGVSGFKAFANGGMTRLRDAAVFPPGRTLFAFREPETKGETFIPHAPSKRRRALEIWRQTGRILGATHMADGGIMAAPTPLAAGGGATFSFTVAGNVYGVDDLERHFRDFQRRLEATQRAGSRYGGTA